MDPGAETLVTLLSPVLQWGFAGFALILLGVLVWTIQQLLGALRSTGDVVANNTQALDRQTSLVQEVRRTTTDLRDRVLAFDCPFRSEA